MADKKLDTQLVNAGRSKKYTLGAITCRVFFGFYTVKDQRRRAPMASCSMDGVER